MRRLQARMPLTPAPRNITLMLTFSHRMTRMIEVREP